MTPNVLGDLLIFCALVFNILVAVFYYLSAQGKTQYENLAIKSYHFLTAVVSIAMVYLFYLFLSESYVVKYVYSYSDSSLPFFYKLSALWGGQEGTYLLWLFMNVLFGYIIVYRSGQYRNYAMVIYAAVNVFFIFIMMKLSPFAIWESIPPDGAGLNPLLQNPWMVIHPPVLFLGYALAGVPFAITMAALIKKDFTNWIPRVFPWVAGVALLLAAGNILGGYWAYITLGWGGFWAWDPVENSSFIPWFVSLALIHSLILEKRTGALRKTNVLLTSFIFITVIYGTFLTRSGVLADFSVHSFVDLGINQYLVVFLILYTIMTFVMFNTDKINNIIGVTLFALFIVTTFWTGGNNYIGGAIVVYILLNLVLIIPNFNRQKDVKVTYNLFNKEFILLCGMFLLFTFTMIVLFWTSLPILTTIFTDEPRAADLSTYNNFALPFAVIFSLLLSVAPLLNFNSHAIKNWIKKLVYVSIGSTVVGFGLFWLLLEASIAFAIVSTIYFTGIIFYLMNKEINTKILYGLVGFATVVILAFFLGVKNYLYLLFIGSATLLIVTNLIAIIGYLPKQLKTAGAHLTHLGFGLMIIGALVSSAYSTNEKVVMMRGESGEAYDMTVSYDGMKNTLNYPKNELLITYKVNGNSYQANPQLYYSERLEAIMKKPYIRNEFLSDYYFAPMDLKTIGAGRGLLLYKDQPRQVSDYAFTFFDYEMDSDHTAGAGASLTAYMQVVHNNDTTLLLPKISMSSTGGTTPDNEGAIFGDNDQYVVSITGIDPKSGSIEIMIPGLTDNMPQDRLILDISKKPIINLVWLGTLFIIFGGIVVYIRRRDELS
jgi:cytochrome c-type biogenesis protein CcmF